MSGVRKIFTWGFLIIRVIPWKNLIIASSTWLIVLYSSSMCWHRKLKKYIRHNSSAYLTIFQFVLLSKSPRSLCYLTSFCAYSILPVLHISKKSCSWSTKTAVVMTHFWPGLVSKGSQLLLVCRPLPTGTWGSTDYEYCCKECLLAVLPTLMVTFSKSLSISFTCSF